jgi:hypothetical protein
MRELGSHLGSGVPTRGRPHLLFRLELHPAFRTATRGTFLDFWVHRTGIDGLQHDGLLSVNHRPHESATGAGD